MALTKEQADQLAELERLRDAPEPEQDDDGPDDGGHVIVLRGSRADSFLESLLGPAPAKRGNAASGPATTKSKKSAPAKSAAEQAEQDADDEDQGDGDQQDDAPPPRANRYFR